MATSDEPLRNNEVGGFGELSLRPNPENLVVVPAVPPEVSLQILQQQLGREPTPEESEQCRQQAAAIAVNSFLAERILLERANQPSMTPAGKPIVPTVTTTYADLPAEEGARLLAASDVLGQHLNSLHNQVRALGRLLLESEAARSGISGDARKDLEMIAALGTVEREAVLRMHGRIMDAFMRGVLRLLAASSDKLRFGNDHAVNYRLALQVKKVGSNEVVEEFDLSRLRDKLTNEISWSWLRRFHRHF